MICVVRWRAMLRGTPDAQRRLEEACRREYDEREQFCGRNRPVRLCGVHWGCFCPQALRPCIFPVRRVLR